MENNDYKKELNEFTYIVSHDLNAPFRHIREFTKLLINKIDDRVADDEKEYCQYIQNSVEKAEAMLEALLVYSRLNTFAHDFSDIDLTDIIDGVFQYHHEEIAHNNISTEYTEIPQNICGDKEQITILFRCLIQNAIQYRNKDVNTQHKIILTGVENPKNKDEWLFTIHDNGRGIHEKYLDQIFTIFKTAHFDEELETVGAGLTIAKKIIWRHGGKIWIDSELGHYTTVRFTLRKQPIEQDVS